VITPNVFKIPPDIMSLIRRFDFKIALN